MRGRSVARVVACLLAVFFLGWVFLLAEVYQSEQALLRHQLEALADHAVQGADALRALTLDPTNQYDRYRAVFHLRSLEEETWKLDRWPGGGFVAPAAGELFPVAAPVSGDYETLPLAEASRNLFEVEGLFRRLATDKVHIGRDDVRQALRQVSSLLAPPAPGR